jgi:signal transduction histidine kinase
MSTFEELIRRIEHGKHDITMRIRGIVLDPIEAINSPNAASSDYFSEQKDMNLRIQKDAQAIMSEFSKKWRDIRSPEDEQLAQMRNQLSRLSDEFIPSIKSIVSFYEECCKHKNYFLDSEYGNWALRRMSKATERVDKVCRDLERIGGDVSETRSAIKVNLLGTIQEVLDDIMADVIYEDELRLSTIEIKTDKDILQNHVLLNIQENISKHAFGTKEFQNKHVWEKKVCVTVDECSDHFLLKIANNGAPFKGKPEMIFKYGYCHGENKHSGVGLNSALTYMRQMGGDIRFESTPNAVFKVSFSLVLPK